MRTASIIVMLAAGPLVAQSGPQSGTSLTVDPGTTLRFEGAQTFAIPSGATVVNNGSIVFGTSASLQEADGYPISGSGTETITSDLTAPLNATDPAGLGLRMTTSAATGITTVTRGHSSFTDSGGQVSLLRWFDVDAVNNSGLNATIAFGYDPIELNGIAETGLTLHVRGPGSNWTYLPPSTVDIGNAEVNSNSLDSLGTFTCFANISTSVEGPDETIGAWLVMEGTSDALVIGLKGPGVLPAITVFDALGRIVAQGSGGFSVERIGISHFAAGVYRVRVGTWPLGFLKP